MWGNWWVNYGRGAFQKYILPRGNEGKLEGLRGPINKDGVLGIMARRSNDPAQHAG